MMEPMKNAPVLDTQALGLLAEELGDPVVLRDFLGRYTAMLQGRINRVERALQKQDPEDWMDALLSLKTSSELACAAKLSRLAHLLQVTYESTPCFDVGTSRGLTTLGHLMHCLLSVGSQTRQEFALLLGELGPGPARTAEDPQLPRVTRAGVR